MSGIYRYTWRVIGREGKNAGNMTVDLDEVTERQDIAYKLTLTACMEVKVNEICPYFICINTPYVNLR